MRISISVLVVCCWSFVVEANGQFSLTRRKIAKQLAAMTHESVILVQKRTHEDIFRQRMKREEIEPSDKLVFEALDEVKELAAKEHQQLRDPITGWWGNLLAKTTGKLLTLGMKAKIGLVKRKSRISEKEENNKGSPLFSEMSEETFIWLMAMTDQQKRSARARIAQFQQAISDPDAIDYSMLSHENFLRFYLEQLSEEDLDILINHLNILEPSP